ncbi:uncharacterized protein LOC133319445 [Danaus plexippus]|uniref:uncharacterized protein LOC133319445 n=1 Tax=Danaus plexippus TaxID=13037 RepID=UPI002AAFAADA|nr:uncharacterized protein LOC133319445 [Danaus plexippus]
MYPISCSGTGVLISFFVLPLTECIIDMNVPQFSHIANSISHQECIKLIASLRYNSYEMPSSLTSVNSNNMSCVWLLIDYSDGKESWQGGNKTHGVIAHRLRQLGRSDLADWLCKAVFHQLAKDINDTILVNPFAVDSTQSALCTKLLKDKLVFVGAEWDIIDITLWMVLAILVAWLVVSCCRLLCLSCRKKLATNEEMIALLKKGSGNNN